MGNYSSRHCRTDSLSSTSGSPSPTSESESLPNPLTPTEMAIFDYSPKGPIERSTHVPSSNRRGVFKMRWESRGEEQPSSDPERPLPLLPVPECSNPRPPQAPVPIPSVPPLLSTPFGMRLRQKLQTKASTLQLPNPEILKIFLSSFGLGFMI